MSNLRQYDELEHEGDENFEFQNRKNVKEVDKKVKELAAKKLEDSKEELQKQWLSIDNPFLWEGDFDT